MFTIKNEYQTLFDISPVGISIVDSERRIIEANSALYRIIGLSSGSLDVIKVHKKEFC